MSTPSVVSFLFDNSWQTLKQSMEKKGSPEVVEFFNSAELLTHLTVEGSCLVVAAVKNKDDLIQVANFLKGAKNTPKNGYKVVVVDFTTDPAIAKAIAKLGITDRFPPNVSSKILRFKIDFLMKTIKPPANAAAPGDAKRKIKANEAEATVENTGLEFEQVSALDCSDDIWIIQNERCKKVGTKWLIQAFGPSPFFGTWVEDKPGSWKFNLTEEAKKSLGTEAGVWVFTGEQKPDFSWSENLWMISGSEYRLGCTLDGIEHVRLFCSKRKLTVANNSIYAETRSETIKSSFDKNLVIKDDKTKASKTEVESDQDIAGNLLSGKSKTDSINSPNLSGKLKKEQSESPHLRGKNSSEVSSDNLSGIIDNDSQLSQDEDSEEEDSSDGSNQESGPLTGKTKGSLPETGNLRGESSSERSGGNFSGGIKETSQPARGSLNGKVGEASEASGNLNGKIKDPSAPSGGALSGKGSSEQIDQRGMSSPGSEGVRKGSELGMDADNEKIDGYMRGHNEHKQYGKKEFGIKKSVNDPEEEAIEAMTEEVAMKATLRQSIGVSIVDVSDYFDDTFVLELPKESKLGKGNSILEVSLEFEGKKENMKLRVITTDLTQEEGRTYLTVEVIPEDQHIALKYAHIHEKRQELISEFMEKAKGE